MKKTKIILETDLFEHSAVKAWREFQPKCDEPEQIEVLKQKKKSSVYRLAGVGPKNSAVIAKRCKYEKAMIERAIYEEVLPLLSVPTPKYYGFIKEQDGLFWWLFLEDIGNQGFSPLIAKHRSLAAQWMGEMNTSVEFSNVNSHLPNQGPEYYQRYLRTVREMIPEIKIFYSLETIHQDLLTNIISMCEFLEGNWNQIERFCNQVPRTLVHGDCQVKNAHVRLTETGQVFTPFDWANAGWGLPATDLGQLSLPYKSLPPTVPDYTTYLTVIRDEWPDFAPETVHQLANLGQIFWSLKVISLSIQEFDERYPYLEGLLQNFSIYASVLAAALQALKLVN
jgi:thiamine kinase-like enzyme